MSEIVLEVEKLVKDYGSFRAVDGISFTLPRGKIIGFLGPNGAGKTTTIQMLLGLTLSNGGTIRYFGKDFATHQFESLQRINAASAFNTLQGRITVFENLVVFSHLYGVPQARKKITGLLERLEIPDLASTLYQNLSSGQKTRVNLIKSLLNDPEILLMDEPTASLDPDIADKTLSLIEELRREREISILYTSHNMNEVARVCDEVIFLDHGKIVAQDTPTIITKQFSSASLCLIITNGMEQAKEYLRANGRTISSSSAIRLEVPCSESDIPELLIGLKHAGAEIDDIEIKKPTLEDVFLQFARNRV